MTVNAYGLRIDPPSGWDVRVYRREPQVPGEQTFPIVHAGTFRLPEQRGDYGSGAVEQMGARDVFLALLEFGPQAVDKPLFARQGRPDPLPAPTFSPGKLQRTISGQSGAQFFFTEAGRSFCLYVVLGSHAARDQLAPRANDAVRSFAVGAH